MFYLYDRLNKWNLDGTEEKSHLSNFCLMCRYWKTVQLRTIIIVSLDILQRIGTLLNLAVLAINKVQFLISCSIHYFPFIRGSFSFSASNISALFLTSAKRILSNTILLCCSYTALIGIKFF